jgi:RND family efflux transporter MFP subunit
MTQLAQPAPATSNRSPYVAATAFFLLLIAIGAVALIPKLRHRDALRTEATVAAGPPIVLATRLAAGDRSSRLELPATIQAFEQTTIFARTSGYIKDRYVDIGDHVRKGQLLAVIEDPQTAQSLLQAEATLAQTKAQLLQAQANAELSSVTNQRWQSLVKAGVVAQQDADQKRAQSAADLAAVTAARANITANQANVASLTQQASFARVTAPFDGIVLSRSIDRGSLISVGSQNSVQPLFTVAQSSTVRVFANVPQSNTVGLRDGQIAQVAVRELGGQTFPGTITRTSQSLDPGTRTLLVEVDLKNDGRILPGMYATVRFDLPPTATPPVMLPANALVIRTSGPQAVVLDANNVAHFRSVTLGRDLGSETEVLKGLQPGDVVVLSPGDDVVEGARVKPEIQQGAAR